MKKLFISLLIGVIVGGCFTGCSKDDDKLTPPEKTKPSVEDVLGKKDKADEDEKEDKDEKDKDDEEKEEKQAYKYTQDKAIRVAEKVLDSHDFDYYEVDFEEDLQDYCGMDGDVLGIYIEQDGAPVDGMIEDYFETGFRDFDMDEFVELVGLDEIKSECKKLYKEVINEIEDKYGKEINVVVFYANEECTPLYMVTSEGEELYNVCDLVEEYMNDYEEYEDDYDDYDDYDDDEYYDDLDYEILEPASDYILNYYLGEGSVTYNRGSNQLICRVTFSKLEMENDFGIPNCTEEDFEEFMMESGLPTEAFELAEMAQEDVRDKFDERLEVIVEIYYSTDLMLRVDANGNFPSL